MNGYYGVKLERVSKRKARKLFNEGRTITCCPYKVNPEGNSPASLAFKSTIHKDDEPFNGFDSWVNAVEYYNCQYAELGKYLAFYVAKGLA